MYLQEINLDYDCDIIFIAVENRKERKKNEREVETFDFDDWFYKLIRIILIEYFRQ